MKMFPNVVINPKKLLQNSSINLQEKKKNTRKLLGSTNINIVRLLKKLEKKTQKLLIPLMN